MRYLMMVMGNDDYQAGKPPSPELMAAINELGQQARKAGKLISSEGLKPVGTRIRLANGKRSVVDGPYAETKELVGGFAIFDVVSNEEALDYAHRFVDAHVKAGIKDFEMVVRPIFGPEDYAICPGEAAAREAAAQPA